MTTTVLLSGLKPGEIHYSYQGWIGTGFYSWGKLLYGPEWRMFFEMVAENMIWIKNMDILSLRPFRKRTNFVRGFVRGFGEM